MKDKDINKIAEAIAAKIGAPSGPVVLGCGDASSTQTYNCSTGHNCTTYECGGAAQYRCSSAFQCNRFNCYTNFQCDSGVFGGCGYRYNE
ncbi:MAG TPA: hypothetical protein VM163_06230 [bacterium]|nr:hypothetical protein [bacterium]